MLKIPNLSSLFSFLGFMLTLLCSISISTSSGNQNSNREQQKREEMYAETGFMQGSSPEIHQFEDLFKSYKNSLVEACEYDFGVESDLFKAPEPIIEEPMLSVDPLSQEIVQLSDLGLLQADQQLFDKAFYECEQDLLVKSAMESPVSEVLDIKNISLVAKMDNVSSIVVSHVPDPKSVSSGNLSLMDTVVQSFPDLPPVDYGMRRAFSESDIQTLGTRNAAGHVLSKTCTSEERREKLSRYRNKKSRRNFRRKIKYACRKTLADSQPRIRGRFAKTEEMQK